MIIGIDPGSFGAVAFIQGSAAICEDCPDNPSGMAALLRSRRDDISHVYIERVHAMPKNGVSGMFKFGQNFGTWIGIIASLELPYTFVEPSSWKKHFKLTGKDKDAARMLAIQLYPLASGQLQRKKDCGRADAILIAMYGKAQP